MEGNFGEQKSFRAINGKRFKMVPLEAPKIAGLGRSASAGVSSIILIVNFYPIPASQWWLGR
jgi:hypothetical protein